MLRRPARGHEERKENEKLYTRKRDEKKIYKDQVTT